MKSLVTTNTVKKTERVFLVGVQINERSMIEVQESLDELAERFYVSKYHLSHLFSRSVGTGVYRYVLLKRLQNAKEQLAGGKTPGEACRESGFQDYANFYRSFRAVYGLSPQEAAKQI